MEQQQAVKFFCGSNNTGCGIVKRGQEGQQDAGGTVLAVGSVREEVYVLTADSVLTAGDHVEIRCNCEGENRVSGKCVASKHCSDWMKPALNMSVCKLDINGKQIIKRPHENGDNTPRITRRILQPTDVDIAPDTQILVHPGGDASPVAAKIRTIELLREGKAFQLNAIHFTCEQSQHVVAKFGSLITWKDKQDVFAYIVCNQAHNPNAHLAAPLWNNLCHLVQCYPDYEDFLKENILSLCPFQISQ